MDDFVEELKKEFKDTVLSKIHYGAMDSEGIPMSIVSIAFPIVDNSESVIGHYSTTFWIDDDESIQIVQKILTTLKEQLFDENFVWYSWGGHEAKQFLCTDLQEAYNGIKLVDAFNAAEVVDKKCVKNPGIQHWIDVQRFAATAKILAVARLLRRIS